MNARLIILFLLTLLGISCSNLDTRTLPSALGQENAKETADSNSKDGKSQLSIPADLDSKFETFIKYFSKDSVFQVSRIDFPLKVKNVDEENEQEIIIKKSQFHKQDFDDKTTETREFDKYKQEIKVNRNKAIVEIRGIDNGIYIDVYFEKKNNKWKLLTWVDSSD
ncbi:MAG: hypothetical protein JWN56_69 [Sphingobacteriales bacterium]|nr:hypothetical protein [Sphingobacteriales bacterium]